MTVEIPKGDYESQAPCWVARSHEGVPAKPAIKCMCGEICYIGLHHVHEDGRVTESFYHSKASEFEFQGRKYAHDPGCGWHVYLTLKDYECGDFPSVP